MKVLVIGAGGVGGYFGGRLIESGADVTFLVRERRARQLAESGLVIKSAVADATLPVRTLTAADPGRPFDLVILTCKSYDLASAIDAAAPHMAAGAGLALPLLNGMAHIDVLRERFGRDRVLGGLCGIFATLSPAGEVVQMAGLPPRLAFGRFKDQMERGVLEEPARAIEQMIGKANFAGKRIEPIEQGLWEKWMTLAAMAGGTCLMRGSIGSIVAGDDGKAIMDELVRETASVARAAGYPPAEEYLATARGILTAAGSDATASMLRDINKGGPTEGDHIVGHMLRRARELGVAAPLLRIANAHLQTYEAEWAKAARPRTMEIAKLIELGFSTADAAFPEIREEDGNLRLRFNDWRERIVEVLFAEAIAYKWEAIASFYEGERNDSCYEILDSSWIAEHVMQNVIKESWEYKHYKLNFNAWGQFEVLAKGCTSKTSQAFRGDAL